jgi:hypothetical protein
MMSRKERAARKAAALVAAPAPVPADGSIADRLSRLEASAPRPWSLAADHQLTVDVWRAAHVRHDAADPCPACGLHGGEQRRRRPGSPGLLPGLWLCPPCMDAVVSGWDTSTTTIYSESEARDRLAALACSMNQPTPGLTGLLSRYGLRLALAREVGPGAGPGTAWGHLGNLTPWAEAGRRATERHAASWPTHPPADPAMPYPRSEVRRVSDPWTGEGEYVQVEVPGTGPTPEELTAQLRDEERQITAELAERRRRERREAKEREAAEQRETREREILAHYREHAAVLEAQLSAAREQLRSARDLALKAPTDWCGGK